jgi:hypothetical protein
LDSSAGTTASAQVSQTLHQLRRSVASGTLPLPRFGLGRKLLRLLEIMRQRIILTSVAAARVITMKNKRNCIMRRYADDAIAQARSPADFLNAMGIHAAAEAMIGQTTVFCFVTNKSSI